MKPGETPLTEAQLQDAWRRLPRPAGWPSTLQEALADPTRAAMLRGYARELLRLAAMRPRSAGRPTQPARHTAQRAAQPRFDPRKAAANDHD